jgi:glycosyltransferase involved in cell wall biosynthesis
LDATPRESPPEVPAPADLAVVIVNYNAGEYFARCVGSVVEASGGLALDLLVVDNASRDVA